MKPGCQGVNSLFCKKKLNNALKTSLSKNSLNIRRRLILFYELEQHYSSSNLREKHPHSS